MRRILQKLEDPNFNDISGVIKNFLYYYNTYDRHKYQEITLYILGKFKNEKESEVVNGILYNLDAVIKEVKNRCGCSAYDSMYKCHMEEAPNFECQYQNEHCLEYKKLYRNLTKLYDHISLEQSRTADVRDGNVKLEELLKKVDEKTNGINTSIRNAEDKIKSIHAKLNDTEEKINNTEKRIDSQQKEYITILGIFASIVLAFTGGIAFSTSVLENIDAISGYRLAAIVAGLALILLNIIYLLAWFIIKINYGNDSLNSPPRFVWIIEILLIVTIIGSIAIPAIKNKIELTSYQNSDAISTTQITNTLEAE